MPGCALLPQCHRRRSIEAGEQWGVTLHGDLMDGLNKLLGAQNVRINYTG